MDFNQVADTRTITIKLDCNKYILLTRNDASLSNLLTNAIRGEEADNVNIDIHTFPYEDMHVIENYLKMHQGIPVAELKRPSTSVHMKDNVGYKEDAKFVDDLFIIDSKQSVRTLGNFNAEKAIRLLNIANYMDIEPLLMLLACTIQTRSKGRREEEIAQEFGKTIAAEIVEKWE